MELQSRHAMQVERSFARCARHQCSQALALCAVHPLHSERPSGARRSGGYVCLAKRRPVVLCLGESWATPSPVCLWLLHAHAHAPVHASEPYVADLSPPHPVSYGNFMVVPTPRSPRRADLVAALGETTGAAALSNMLARMQSSPGGRQILAERPRITVRRACLGCGLSAGVMVLSLSVSERDWLQASRMLMKAVMQDETLEYAGTLPEGTFGHAYAHFMGRRRYAVPDSRSWACRSGCLDTMHAEAEGPAKPLSCIFVLNAIVDGRL